MIDFFSEDIEFDFKNTELITAKIKYAIRIEKKYEVDLNIIFCSDNYLLKMNKKYLNHDYFTDVITFDYSENNKLSGDIFISIETVKENALQYYVDFSDELERVILHGVLHLIGYNDKSEKEKKIMREKEDFYMDYSSV